LARGTCGRPYALQCGIPRHLSPYTPTPHPAPCTLRMVSVLIDEARYPSRHISVSLCLSVSLPLTLTVSFTHIFEKAFTRIPSQASGNCLLVAHGDTVAQFVAFSRGVAEDSVSVYMLHVCGVLSPFPPSLSPIPSPPSIVYTTTDHPSACCIHVLLYTRLRTFLCT